MSKDLPQQPQQSEEVDLGQLFKMIGNMFDRFFKFIGNVLNRVYNIFLMLLIHLFKRLKWYLFAIVLGVVIGYFLDKSAPYLYAGNMQVETKYKSARQVYENISFLNQLASKDRDTVELAKRFGISLSEAGSILGFSIEPDIDENDKMKLFSDFRAQLDSLTKSTFTYNDYLDGLTSHSFETHQISVISTDKFIFPKLNDSLKHNLANNNSYLKEIRDVTMENFVRREKSLEIQKNVYDSLVLTYLDIRKTESQKDVSQSTGGTNLFLGDALKQQNLIVDETQLIERKLELDNEIQNTYKGRVQSKNIVNVISEFPDAGYNVDKFTDKSKIRVPILFLIITFLIFLFIGLKKYIEKEEERLLM
ncbi:hypothetical protein SAMN05421824_0416 [Hyunsoonleella jejuensis]|uniref:Chain length determinant protein n=1 Tax=Hyunsoonleella jejuensis TaxID=419940 RepID=A0A1H9B0U3_9FLAO|nr:hypothetical protein [Hyunsoonleella jejuensis]SEP82632.1 hypothetical protein SAMN05421824_0416 [Hyunsoonleella jejuensis]